MILHLSEEADDARRATQGQDFLTPEAWLLLLLRCCRRRRRLLRRSGGLRFRLVRLHTRKHRTGTGLAGGIDGKNDGRDHEDHGRPGSRLGKSGCGAAGAECGLAPLSTESGSEITALAALQQHDGNQKQGNRYVNNRDKNCHPHAQNSDGAEARIPKSIAGKAERWCGRGDLNPHAFRRHPLKMVCLPVPPLPHVLNQPDSTRCRSGPQEDSTMILSR